MTPEAAKEIYSQNIDVVSNAMWTRNWPVLKDHLALPTRLTCNDGDVLIETEDHFRQMIFDLRDSLAAMGATEFHRVCQEARFLAPDRITGSHITYVLRGSSFATQPYVSTQFLQLKSGRWRAVDITSDVSNQNLTVVSPRVVSQLIQQRQHV